MTTMQADRPTAVDGKQYHLETGPGDLAERCLLVGAPERAELIANKFFDSESVKKVGDHRGLKSFTGAFQGVRMSVVTHGMGGASIGIVLPEAVRSGARVFVRVGSCAALKTEAKVGQVVIGTGAVRFDGASENWAPIEYPAIADWRVVGQLVSAATALGLSHHVGIGVTTSCFNEGQARPDDTGYVPPRLLQRHEELIRRGALFYAMEEASLMVWCSTHGHIPCGVVNTVYANRVTNDFSASSDLDAARIALHALFNHA